MTIQDYLTCWAMAVFETIICVVVACAISLSFGYILYIVVS